MQNTWLDLRYAIRGLFRSPMFAAVAICSMAIGIGANTAVFSVFNAVLLRPFPYPDADALIVLYESQPQKGLIRYTVSPPDFLTWRQPCNFLIATSTSGRRSCSTAKQTIAANIPSSRSRG
jgi:putative ABC transport system permease protein